MSDQRTTAKPATMATEGMVPLALDSRTITTADGWRLHLRRAVAPGRFERSHRPVLLVPGYGMNSYILRFHPRGTSMVRALAEAGYEVWSMDLRGQADSHKLRGQAGGESLWHYAMFDLPAAIAGVLAGTASSAGDVIVFGCSLGGTIAYSYLALQPRVHRVAQLVTMASPLRWDAVHPVVRSLFSSPFLARRVRVSGLRSVVRGVMPLLLRAPRLVELYMNTSTIDTRHMGEITRTVEDPPIAVNVDIAHWMRDRDLKVGGIDIASGLAAMRMPLLVVLGNRDGVVPEPTVMSVVGAWGGDDVQVLRVGDRKNWYGHANLFVADDAPELVFQPIIRWLQREGRQSGHGY